MMQNLSLLFYWTIHLWVSCKNLRSCAILLQDHYPNQIGCLFTVRLPYVARVITQTLFQQHLRLSSWPDMNNVAASIGFHGEALSSMLLCRKFYNVTLNAK